MLPIHFLMKVIEGLPRRREVADPERIRLALVRYGLSELEAPVEKLHSLAKELWELRLASTYNSQDHLYFDSLRFFPGRPLFDIYDSLQDSFQAPIEGFEQLSRLVISLIIEKEKRIPTDEEINEFLRPVRENPEKYSQVMGAWTGEGVWIAPGKVGKAWALETEIERTLEEILQEPTDEALTKAIRAQGVFRVPAIEEAIRKGKFSKRNEGAVRAYLERIKKLTTSYPNVLSSIKSIIGGITEKVEVVEPASPTIEIPKPDKETFYEAIELTEELERGYELDSLAKFLFRTKIRRGRCFTFSVDDGVKIKAYSKPPTGSFEEIVGPTYKPNVSLLEKMLKEKGQGYLTLLVGPPGTGKTLSLRGVIGYVLQGGDIKHRVLIAAEIRDLDTFFNKIREIAELHPELWYIVLIDDFDVHVPEFKRPKELLDVDSLAPTPTLPDNVLVLATTNQPHKIDRAVLRRPGRTRYVLMYPSPKAEDREELVEHYEKVYGIRLDEDLKKYIVVNTEGLSCDEVRFILQELSSEKVINRKVIDFFINQLRERRKLETELEELAKRKEEMETSLFA